MEFKNDNDYTITVFKGKTMIKSWQFVHNLYSAKMNLNRICPEWEYMNVYARRTRRFIGRFYANASYIPQKPK